MRPWFGLCLVLISVGCGFQEPLPRKHARGALGVFFGGQVQERHEVRVASPSPPTVGFRIHFPEPLDVAHTLEYEVVRPGPNSRRVTEVSRVEIPPGRTHFDQRIELGSVIAYGTWNVRVLCDGVAVLDRALLVTREP